MTPLYDVTTVRFEIGCVVKSPRPSSPSQTAHPCSEGRWVSRVSRLSRVSRVSRVSQVSRVSRVYNIYIYIYTSYQSKVVARSVVQGSFHNIV
jgi:hypothetical protein